MALRTFKVVKLHWFLFISPVTIIESLPSYELYGRLLEQGIMYVIKFYNIYSSRSKRALAFNCKGIASVNINEW